MVDPVRPVPNGRVLPETVMISNIKPAIPELSYRVLHQKYVQEGLSLTQLSRHLASSRTRIRKALVSFDIPIKTKKYCFNSTNVPYGKVVSEAGLVVDCKVEQRNIRLILKLRNSGLSLKEICRKLEERKIPTKTGREVWHSESLRQVIKKNQIE